jgi:hypothetical protein
VIILLTERQIKHTASSRRIGKVSPTQIVPYGKMNHETGTLFTSSSCLAPHHHPFHSLFLRHRSLISAGLSF